MSPESSQEVMKPALATLPFGLKLGAWPGGAPAWGTFRAPLTPDASTNTYGRGGFFIHGGYTPGSAGCIDLCGSDVGFFSAIDRGAGTIPVDVSYPD